MTPTPARKVQIAAHPAHRDDIGDLVTRRPLPGPAPGVGPAIDRIDPFLFLNHHGPQVYPPGNRGLPFGPHPHRGFETVTFVLEGELAHRDSGGHESVIGAGGVQWMTAGRGVVHEELSPAAFKRQGGPLEILQLWVNLPARLKMTAPRYTGLPREALPVVATADGRGAVTLIAGTIPDPQGRTVTGPIVPLTDFLMATVTLESGGGLRLDGLEGRTVFLYVVRGAVRIGDAAGPAHHLLELSREGDSLDITAEADSLLLLGHAPPLGEPVVAHGPFVMNTRQEIQQAVFDYQAGRFDALPLRS